jgi:hypothetical protein
MCVGLKSFRQGLATGLDACGGIYDIIRRPFELDLSFFCSETCCLHTKQHRGPVWHSIGDKTYVPKFSDHNTYYM